MTKLIAPPGQTVPKPSAEQVPSACHLAEMPREELLSMLELWGACLSAVCLVNQGCGFFIPPGITIPQGQLMVSQLPNGAKFVSFLSIEPSPIPREQLS